MSTGTDNNCWCGENESNGNKQKENTFKFFVKKDEHVGVTPDKEALDLLWRTISFHAATAVLVEGKVDTCEFYYEVPENKRDSVLWYNLRNDFDLILKGIPTIYKYSLALATIDDGAQKDVYKDYVAVLIILYPDTKHDGYASELNERFSGDSVYITIPAHNTEFDNICQLVKETAIKKKLDGFVRIERRKLEEPPDDSTYYRSLRIVNQKHKFKFIHWFDNIEEILLRFENTNKTNSKSFIIGNSTEVVKSYSEDPDITPEETMGDARLN